VKTEPCTFIEGTPGGSEGAFAVGSGSGVEIGTGVGVADRGVGVAAGWVTVGPVVGVGGGGSVVSGSVVGVTVVGIGCAVWDGEMAWAAVGASDLVLSKSPHATTATIVAIKAA